MPWASIIVAVISFVITYLADGHKAGTAALVAAGSGLATYAYSASPYAPSWLQQADGIPSSGSDTTTAGTTNVMTGQPGATGAVSGNAPGLGGTVSSLGADTAKVLSSWGGTGTAEVVGATTVAANSGSILTDLEPYLPYILIGGAAILLAKS